MPNATERMSAKEYLALEGESASEREHQEAVFEWAEAKAAEVVELSFLFAIPNGQMRQGMPMEPGLKSGVPDLFLAVPNERHTGLFIEMKRPGGRLREEQREWIEALRNQAYRAEVCYGAEEAIDTITEYLGIE